MKHIGIITSGGDSPGMNACIRAIVRTASFNDIKVTGFYRGYEGLLENDSLVLTRYDVRNIIHRGGTFLKTSRSEEFRTQAGRSKASKILKNMGIEGLIVIGGDGSLIGANLISIENDIPVIGCPGTIDNDLFGTDFTIGYHTAVDTAIEAVDNIRDTASSHNRLFFVEVMGRDAGLIALRTGIAAGAEGILIPETPSDINRLVKYLKTDFKKKRRSGIIIVAEGESEGGAFEVAKKVQREFPEWEMKVTVLGHIQRGGKPNGFDRILASRIGHGALLALNKGRNREMIGISGGELIYTPLEKAVKHNSTISPYLLELVEALS
ncbi:MAG: ATP-dependent 6-phosphofructokinase 1 [Owenweeksia sp. TMED14]|nr:MAG: ATP-dependent 6-phosphofructokinase 1 [Owenweeksia sp. TMED14]|tara:strand:- start:1461 stop:2429 length:969 start_codon:yes stop_codon:yes gene_type:complete